MPKEWGGQEDEALWVALRADLGWFGSQRAYVVLLLRYVLGSAAAVMSCSGASMSI